MTVETATTIETTAIPRGKTNGKAAQAIAAAEPLTRSIIQVHVDQVDVGPNVRKAIAGVEELAASIKAHGVLQPIKVRSAGDRWQVVWGQRRLMAARLAGLERIPAIIATAEEISAAQLSIEQLVENLHRADLNPMDRARALQEVVDSGVKQAELARQLGLAPSTIANDLALLRTHAAVQHSLEAGELSTSHAKAIATLDVDLQPELVEKVVSQGYSAHETERQAKYVAESAKRIRDDRAEAEKRAVDAIALLEKVASRDSAAIALAAYSGGGEALAKLLEADGWKVLSQTDGWNVRKVDQAGACGCKGVWRLEIPYGAKPKLELAPGCESKDHQAAAQAEQTRLWEQKRAAQAKQYETERAVANAQSTQRETFVVELLTATPGDPLAQRLALAAIVDLDPDEDLIAQYIPDGDREAFAELSDPTWTLLEAIPDVDLPKVVAAAVAGVLLNHWQGMAGILEAIDARLPQPEAEPEATPAAEPEATPAPKPDRVPKLEEPALLDDRQFRVLAVVYPGQNPVRVMFRPADAELGTDGSDDVEIPLAAIAWDKKAKAWTRLAPVPA